MAGPFLTKDDATSLVGSKLASPPADVTTTQALVRDSTSSTGTNWRPPRVVANVSSAGAVSIADPVFDDYTVVTMTGNISVTFPAVASGKAFTLVLKQDGTGGRTVSLPAGILWPGAAAPTLSTGANRQDVLRFISFDGTNWVGYPVALNVG